MRNNRWLSNNGKQPLPVSKLILTRALFGKRVSIKFCNIKSRLPLPSRGIGTVVCALDVKSKMGYWDLQEGKDCIEKTWITTKLATALGKPYVKENIAEVSKLMAETSKDRP